MADVFDELPSYEPLVGDVFDQLPPQDDALAPDVFDQLPPYKPEVPALLTRAEFEEDYLKKLKQPVSDKASALVQGVSEGIGGLAQNAADAWHEFNNTPGSTARVPATLVEGAARGTYDMADSARRIVGNDKVNALLSLMSPGLLADPETLAAWSRIAHPSAPETIDAEYDKYLNNHAWEATRRDGLDDSGNVAPKFLGEPLPAVAETASLVLDPSMAIPIAGQATKLANVGRRLIGHAALPIAKGVEAGAGVVGRGVKVVSEQSARVIEKAGMSPEAAQVAVKAAGVGALATGPGMIAGKVAGAAKVSEMGAQAARAVAEEVVSAPSQLTISERIARDASKPAWLRKASRAVAGIPEPLTRTAGAAVEGLLQGAVMGGGLALATDQDAAGVGRGMGAGSLLGTAGAVYGAARPSAREAARVRAEDGDIAAMIARQETLGGDVDRLSVLDREKLRQIATLQRVFDDSTDVIFTSGEKFQSEFGAGAGAHAERMADGRSRVVINLDANESPARIVAHELGHAILRSPAINKDAARLAIDGLYPEPVLDAMGREYVRRKLEGEAQRLPPALPPPLPTQIDAGLRAELGLPEPGSRAAHPDPRAIAPQQVETAFQEARQQAIDAGDLDGRDWIRDEVFAEHFAGEMDGKGLRMDHLRKGLAPGADVPRFQEAILSLKGKVLGALGVPFDQAGKISEPLSRLFAENPLLRDPTMQKLVAGFGQDRQQWIAGLQPKGEAHDTPIGTPLLAGRDLKPLAASPAIEWRPHPDGYSETDFAIKTADGRVSLKDTKEIAATEKLRAAQALMLVPGQILPAESTAFGRKRIDGKEVTGGATLPEMFDHLKHFPAETRAAARAMEASRDTGGTWGMWYHQIGTGANGSWAASVRKGLGNVAATQRELAHVGWEVTKAGNIVGKMLDVGAARARAFELQNQGRLTLWGGNVDAFHKDLMTYLANHAAGTDGSAGIGTGKRDAINGFFGVSTAANRTANPLHSGQYGRSLIKSFRLDRMQNIQPTGRTGWPVDYHRMKHNLLPDAPARRVEMPQAESRGGP